MAGSLPAADPSGSLKRGAPGTGSLVLTVVAAACARIGEDDSETRTTAEGIPA
jgi:hypothetical protein